MPIQSLNPATGEVVKQFNALSAAEVETKLTAAHVACEAWRSSSFAVRRELLLALAVELRRRAAELAGLITLEIGRPVTPSLAEIEKCAWVCEYYAQEGERLLTPELIATDAAQSGVRFDPLGVVLAVMPWNFPFWQVMRCVAPALMSGNTVVLKHASCVPQCALAIEDVVRTAAAIVNAPAALMQTLLIPADQVSALVADPRIAAATLTGSERAGVELATACAKAVKPVVLELGGSDPFIVLDDADVAQAAKVAITARFQNAGQSCIAAKRCIVIESVAEEFTAQLVRGVEALQVGDPTNPSTQMGPLVSQRAVEEMEAVVQDAVSKGAQVLCGGKRLPGAGFFFAPTVLSNVTPDMLVWTQEVFGPVFPVLCVPSESQAVTRANQTPFGLGASVWTRSAKRAAALIPQLQAGAVFVNGMVKSDPRLPFGGTKTSGLGRELGEYGIKSFTNVKTFWVAQ